MASPTSHTYAIFRGRMLIPETAVSPRHDRHVQLEPSFPQLIRLAVAAAQRRRRNHGSRESLTIRRKWIVGPTVNRCSATVLPPHDRSVWNAGPTGLSHSAQSRYDPERRACGQSTRDNARGSVGLSTHMAA